MSLYNKKEITMINLILGDCLEKLKEIDVL